MFPGGMGGSEDSDRRSSRRTAAQRHHVVQPEVARQERVIPHFGVTIEREMARVKGHVRRMERAHPAPVPPGEALEPTPEHPMMHHEERGAARCCRIDGCLARVNSRSDAAQTARVLDLQAVEGTGVVLDQFDIEILVRVGNDIINRISRHYQAIIVCPVGLAGKVKTFVDKWLCG